ncbi:MAG: tandem-95 repeat protein, partial [Betaproteobacteria bacterium]
MAKQYVIEVKRANGRVERVVAERGVVLRLQPADQVFMASSERPDEWVPGLVFLDGNDLIRRDGAVTEIAIDADNSLREVERTLVPGRLVPFIGLHGLPVASGLILDDQTAAPLRAMPIAPMEFSSPPASSSPPRRVVEPTPSPVNWPVQAGDDSYSLQQGGLLTVGAAAGVRSNDATPDGFGSLMVVAAPQHGSLTMTADGSFAYTPTADFHGSDYFTYRLFDSDGDSSDAIVQILVVPVGTDHLPVAVDDIYVVAEDGTLNVAAAGVLANDAVADGLAGLDVVQAPQFGSMTLAADGSFIYVPRADYNGDDRFVYRLTDADGDQAIATVYLSITPVNDAPQLQIDRDGVVTEDIAVVGGRLRDTGSIGASDVDSGDVLSFAFTYRDDATWSGGALDAAQRAAVSSGFALVGDAWEYSVDNGAVQFLAAGETIRLSYLVSVDDGSAAANAGASDTVAVVVYGTNDAPEVGAAGSGTVTEATDNAAGENSIVHSASGTLTFRDVDLADTHSATAVAVGGGYAGILTLAGVDQDANTVGWTYGVGDAALDSLAAGQTLTQTYLVTVADGHGGSASQSIDIVLTGTNDAPVLGGGSDQGTVVELATPPVGSLTASGALDFGDVDLSDVHASWVASYVGSGTPLGSLTAAVTKDSTGSGSGGVLTWTYVVDANALEHLAPGQQRLETFDVALSDGLAVVTRAVTVTLVGVNDPPVADDENVVGRVDTPLTIAVLAGDVDPDGDPVYLTSFDTVGDRGGTLSRDTRGTAATTDDRLIYAPAAGFTGVETFQYAIDDGNGGTDVGAVTVTVSATGGSPPTANDDTAAAQEDGAAVIVDVLANDTDPDGAADSKIVVGLDTTGLAGTATIAVGGASVRYDPGSGFQSLAEGETTTTQFRYTMADGLGNPATAVVTVTVTGVNDPVEMGPAGSGAATEVADNAADENSKVHSATGGLGFTDIDLIDTHSASLATAPASYLGSLTLTGVDQGANTVGWSYAVGDAQLDSLAAGQTLTQTYLVTVADGQGGSASQSISIVLTGTNDAPVITSAAQSGTAVEVADGAAGENSITHSASGTLSFADVDLIDTHSAAVAAVGGGYVGSLTLGGLDQSTDAVGWSYTVDDAALDSLAAGQTLTQTYLVTLADGQGGSASQSIDIVLTGTNDAPVITSAAQSGTAVEVADGAAGENSITHSASGTLSFADVDLIDTHSAAVAAVGGGYVGSLT